MPGLFVLSQQIPLAGSKGGDGDWEGEVGVKVEMGTGGGAWESRWGWELGEGGLGAMVEMGSWGGRLGVKVEMGTGGGGRL